MNETITALAARLAESNQAITELQSQEPATLTTSAGALPSAEEERFEAIRALREEADDIADRLEFPFDETEQPVLPNVAAAAPDGLAVVVGHTFKRPGARGLRPPFRDDPSTSVHEDHEYGWNSELAEMIRAFADQHSIRCAIFKRDIGGIKGAYDRVKQFRPLATVELHFNSAAVAATGSETLYGGAASEHWASLLQEQMVKLYGRSPTDRSNHDRGLKLRNKAGDRGRASVTQLHPSALIEPFFAHVRSDAERGFHNKQGLAEAVVHAYANMVGMTLSGSTKPQPQPRCTGVVDVRDKPDFVSLAELYAKTDIEFPSLKTITLAQWALVLNLAVPSRRATRSCWTPMSRSYRRSGRRADRQSQERRNSVVRAKQQFCGEPLRRVAGRQLQRNQWR
jgi:hypothetical protein